VYLDRDLHVNRQLDALLVHQHKVLPKNLQVLGQGMLLGPGTSRGMHAHPALKGGTGGDCPALLHLRCACKECGRVISMVTGGHTCSDRVLRSCSYVLILVSLNGGQPASCCQNVVLHDHGTSAMHFAQALDWADFAHVNVTIMCPAHLLSIAYF
jgi:hypothetical protein